jgi:lipid II:glycine glycyltransferase (peptidoglycan interpeptide bridge formation enzyme)
MEILEVTPEKQAIYNAFVARNNGSFLQSWEWGEWQESQNKKAVRYIVRDAAYNALLAIQFLRYPLPLGQYYLYCPYGPTHKLEMQGDQCKVATQELLQHVQKQHPKALFIKLEPQSRTLNTEYLALSTKRASRIQPGSTLLLSLTKAEEQLLAEMHQKTRYNIRVAEKHGVKIASGTDLCGKEAAQVIQLVAQTTTRQGYRGHPKEYYERFCAFFDDHQNQSSDMNVSWYVATLHGDILSGGIFVDFGGTRTYLYGGSSDAFKNVMAPYALHWQAVREAKEMELIRYDFGGLETTSGTTPGFARFKLGFGGTQITYPPAIDVYSNKAKYLAYKTVKRLLK